MPAPAHTPASRRFLPTSSSSRSQVNPSSSVHRRPFAGSSYTPSSPFVKTPYKQQPQIQRDEIEVGFEKDDEDDEQLPSPSHANTVQRAKPSHQDTIEDVVEYDLDKDVELDDDAEYIHSRGRQVTGSSDRSDQFSSPLPKRQKRSHRIELDDQNDHRLSSPSTDKHIGNLTHRTGMVEDEDSDAVSSADEAHLAKSRFQPLTPASFQPSQTPVRTGFRSLFQNISKNETSHLNSPLPETFSPSRRRGKTEYMPGGAAETTRTWILEIANEQSRDTHESGKSINLVSSSKDESGRFEIAEDDQESMWMMVYHDGRPPSHVIQQKAVRLRGTKTSWNVQFDSEKQLNVAVLWDRV